MDNICFCEFKEANAVEDAIREMFPGGDGPSYDDVPFLGEDLVDRFTVEVL